MENAANASAKAASATEIAAQASATQARMSLVTARAAQAGLDLSLAAIRQANRAWLRVEVDPARTPIFFDVQGMGIPIAFKIWNIGNAPALAVSTHVWPGVLRNDAPQPEDVQRIKCEELRQQKFMHSYTIFPNEEFPKCIGMDWYQTLGKIDQQDVDAGAAFLEGKGVSLWVVVCVDYTFPTDIDGHHQTSFILKLHRRDTIHFPIKGPTRPEDIILFRSPFGGPEYVN